ncbi:uncharacterized protein EAE98_001109 [Botrytis deweyae]|uniref:Uncharacterized protein n=1 Tax=Botrytis deweyae TaxID=2478750 RepID=A0ABQ7J0J7_9HELO|nr:uncharacterized protein EAE98_001109 [Botrytis deweyae]KAF7938771.1 hypothetical protein EAE98_001109 [Botrytis deweyae]KAF7942086.1 hypothetical protein EAE99_000137 [Botrytis elliptica]
MLENHVQVAVPRKSENMPPRTFKPYSKAAPRNSPIVSDGTSRVELDILWASVQMKGFGARGEFRTGSEI